MGNVVGCRASGWLPGRAPTPQGPGLRPWLGSLRLDLNLWNTESAAGTRKLVRMRLGPAWSPARAHARCCPRPAFRAPAGRVTSGGLIRKRRRPPTRQNRGSVVGGRSGAPSEKSVTRKRKRVPVATPVSGPYWGAGSGWTRGWRRTRASPLSGTRPYHQRTPCCLAFSGQHPEWPPRLSCVNKAPQHLASLPLYRSPQRPSTLFSAPRFPRHLGPPPQTEFHAYAVIFRATPIHPVSSTRSLHLLLSGTLSSALSLALRVPSAPYPRQPTHGHLQSQSTEHARASSQGLQDEVEALNLCGGTVMEEGLGWARCPHSCPWGYPSSRLHSFGLPFTPFPPAQPFPFWEPPSVPAHTQCDPSSASCPRFGPHTTLQ